MTSYITKWAAAVAVVWASANGVMAQQSTNQVSTKTAWSVFEEKSPKECWAVSAPAKTVNTKDGKAVSVNRGDILLMVFYRPAAGVTGQVAFTGGYPFAKGSTVDVVIGGEKFQLYPEGEWAWPGNTSEDGRLINAMKRGATAELSARSGRGTITRDTFSLSGFTAAVGEAEKRCK